MDFRLRGQTLKRCFWLVSPTVQVMNSTCQPRLGACFSAVEFQPSFGGRLAAASGHLPSLRVPYRGSPGSRLQPFAPEEEGQGTNERNIRERTDCSAVGTPASEYQKQLGERAAVEPYQRRRGRLGSTELTEA